MRYNAPRTDALEGATDAASAEQRRHPTPYESPYQAYIDHSNALNHLAAQATAV